jgi:hypothetical protein
LLSTTQEKIDQMTEVKKLEYLEKFQIEGIAAKKISQLFE